jgi:hypothetical protein
VPARAYYPRTTVLLTILVKVLRKSRHRAAAIPAVFLYFVSASRIKSSGVFTGALLLNHPATIRVITEL